MAPSCRADLISAHLSLGSSLDLSLGLSPRPLRRCAGHAGHDCNDPAGAAARELLVTNPALSEAMIQMLLNLGMIKNNPMAAAAAAAAAPGGGPGMPMALPPQPQQPPDAGMMQQQQQQQQQQRQQQVGARQRGRVVVAMAMVGWRSWVTACVVTSAVYKVGGCQ